MPGRSGLVLLDLLSLDTNSLVVLREPVCELLVGRLLEYGLLPEVWSQVGIGGSHRSVGGLGKVTKGAGGSSGAGVAVLDTGHLQQLLGDGGGHDPGTAGSGAQSHPDGATLASHLAGNSVGLADLVTPETTSDGNDGELGQDDGATDSGGHLLGALHTQTHVSIVVTNSYESLEPGPLASSGLLLDRHDLENLVLQSGTDEHVNDLVLFDGERVEIDLLQALDLSILHQTAELGYGNPVLLFLASASPASSATASAASATASPATITKSSSESTTF